MYVASFHMDNTFLLQFVQTAQQRIFLNAEVVG